MSKQRIRYEAGQTLYGWTPMTDSGDATTFATAGISPWSDIGRDYDNADVKAYGIATGGAIAGNGVNDQVSVGALTAFMPGSTAADSNGLVIVAGNAALPVGSRPASGMKAIVSITVNASGALAVIKGTDNATTVTTRAAAGGPPLIPVGSIEIGQVTLSGNTSVPVVADDISVVPGAAREESASPGFAIDRTSGTITFYEALPLIHTGSLPKKVYARPATPVFAKIDRARDFKPADQSGSPSPVDTYDGPIASKSVSLGTGGFVFTARDGITDSLLALDGQTVWIEYKHDEMKSPKVLMQGAMFFDRSAAFPASGLQNVTVTIVATSKAVNVA